MEETTNNMYTVTWKDKSGCEIYTSDVIASDDAEACTTVHLLNVDDIGEITKVELLK